MSSASMLVRFPDGEIRFGIYYGTSDIVLPWLFDDLDDAWEQKRNGVRTWDEQPIGEVFDVDIYSAYGYGWTWRGRAARNVVLPPFGPDDLPPATWEGQDLDDRPDWVRPVFEDGP